MRNPEIGPQSRHRACLTAFLFVAAILWAPMAGLAQRTQDDLDRDLIPDGGKGDLAEDLLGGGLPGLNFESPFSADGSGEYDLDDLTSGVVINAQNSNYDSDTGTATARGDVHIAYNEVEIFADEAQYHKDSGDIKLIGDVIIIKGKAVDGSTLYKGDQAIYNIRTERITADSLQSSMNNSIFWKAEEFSTEKNDDRDFMKMEDAFFTTHDSATPNYRLKAKTIRIYPDDRIVFENVQVLVGDTPVFWLPYLSQAFDEDLGYTFTPGYRSDWGAFLLNQYGMLVGDHSLVQWKFDIRSDRGVAGGLDLMSLRHKNNENFGRIRLYYAHDSAPDTNVRSSTRSNDIDSSRYRINVQHRIYLPGPEESSLYIDIDINKISDIHFLEDFFPEEYRLDPAPDNIVSLVKHHDRGTLSLLGRFAANDFYRTDTRLPELALDFTRQQIAESNFYYEGETSFGVYKSKLSTSEIDIRNDGIADIKGRLGDPLLVDDPLFDPDLDQGLLDELLATADESGFNRLHTFHQVLYPHQFFDWLNVTPRAGIGATLYNSVDSGRDFGSETRSIATLGVDASFKLSKTFDDVHKPAIGLDGIRHVLQPYARWSFVEADDLPEGFPRVDRLVPSTSLRPPNLTQFTAVDDIRSSNIFRLGAYNRLLTKRDGNVHPWLELNSYFDVFAEDPEFDRDTSNLFNEIRWSPLPWVRLDLETQLPVFGDEFEFSEVNSRVTFMPTEHTELTLGYRFLNDHPFFLDSSQVYLRAYARLNDNWGIGAYQRWELEDNTLEVQQYTVHRDLSSWTAAFGAIMRDNRGEDEYGFIISLTLKEFPRVRIPVDFDPQGAGR